MGVKVTDKTDDVKRALKVLTTRRVLVGIPAVNDAREPDGDKPNPIGNAALGYIHEFGSPAKNIPARPFLVPGVTSIRDQAIAILKKAAQKALDGDIKPIDKALMAVGLMAQVAVQNKMKDGPFVPLAARTLKARERRGRTGTAPLLDTGRLRQAIKYVIRDKGK
jgi:phage gpG-like protein